MCDVNFINSLIFLQLNLFPIYHFHRPVRQHMPTTPISVRTVVRPTESGPHGVYTCSWWVRGNSNPLYRCNSLWPEKGIRNSEFLLECCWKDSIYHINQFDNVANKCENWFRVWVTVLFAVHFITVKPVCNDHLYNKIYYLWFVQWCILIKSEGTNILLLTVSAFWSSSRWPLAT